MKRQHTHADWTLLPWGRFLKRPNIQLIAEIELSSSFSERLLDGFAFFFMLLPMPLLAVPVAVPNALTVPALHEFIALLSALRAQVRGFTLELLPPNFFAKRLLQTEIFSTTNGKISTTNGKKLSP